MPDNQETPDMMDVLLDAHAERDAEQDEFMGAVLFDGKQE